jgi:hypothetical protein
MWFCTGSVGKNSHRFVSGFQAVELSILFEFWTCNVEELERRRVVNNFRQRSTVRDNYGSFVDSVVSRESKAIFSTLTLIIPQHRRNGPKLLLVLRSICQLRFLLLPSDGPPWRSSTHNPFCRPNRRQHQWVGRKVEGVTSVTWNNDKRVGRLTDRIQ